jgi:serine/threonine-protein kinase
LQLSRSSVLTDMTAARGAQAVPKGLQKLVTDQGTDARYHINRPLAAGGMGAVLDIQDNDFRRGAAMKVMHGRFTNDPQALERFLAEAQVTAQLEHPNIVPIHDMGVMPDGSLYFTMKLIEGLSLGDVVKLQRIHAGLLTRDD